MAEETVVYALFRDNEKAAAAVDALFEAGVREQDVSVLVDEKSFGQTEARDLPTEATDVRRGIRNGLLVGGATGAVAAGLFAGPFGLLGVGPTAAAVFGAGAGSIFGALGGALAGSSVPRRDLEQIAAALEDGSILVAVTVSGDDRAAPSRVRRILDRHRGPGSGADSI